MNASSLKAVHSSAATGGTDEWATPWPFVEALARRLGQPFALDPCATDENAKASHYFTEEMDGIAQEWGTGMAFVNPPYSEVGRWIDKASRYRAACLVPARTDTKWFQEFAPQASRLIFLKGRLKFGGGKNSAPFPSCVFQFHARMPDVEVTFEDWKTW